MYLKGAFLVRQVEPMGPSVMGSYFRGLLFEMAFVRGGVYARSQLASRGSVRSVEGALM